jgi:hypothetical protein
MSETELVILGGVSETSLAPLYWRAMESLRPDAMIKDEKAVALVAQMSYLFDRVKQIPMNELLNSMRLIFTREMDRYARNFLSRHPEAVVVHIGCGLDSRFERVDNGQVEWFDLDLPHVIELRRKFIGDEGERYHLLACSALEDAWLEASRWCSRCATISQTQSWSSTAGDHSKSGWVTATSPSPTPRLRVLCAGASGAARRSKVGATASACSTSGASSTSLSRGWTPIAGWLPSFACSNQCASSTSSLEKQ